MKYFLSVFLLWGLFVAPAVAQHGEPDSLYRVFEQAASEAQRLQAANKIVAILLREKAIEHRCHFGSGTPKDSIRMMVYGGGSTYYFQRSDFERANRFSKIGIEACKALKDTVMLSECLDILGASYIRMGDYENAHQTMKVSRELAEGKNDKEGMATVYSNMGTLYSYMKKDSLAISLYLKSVAITRTLKDEGALARRLSNLGEAYIRVKQPEKALKLFNEALALDAKLGNTDRVAIRQSNMANAYMEMKQYKEAEKYYLKSIATLREMDKKSSLAISYYQMGLLKEKTAQLQQAETYYKQAEETARKIKFVYIEKNAGEGLYRVYKNSNPALALAYLEKTKALGDSLYKAETQKQISEFEVKHKTREKETELLLNEQKLKTARIAYGSLAAVLTLFVAFVVYLLFSMKRRNRQNRLLAQLNDTKDKLFSIISHDLKSPVAAQKMAVENLLESFDEHDKLSLLKNLKGFHHATETQLDLLQNLLNWARVQTGQMKYRPALFDITAMAKEVVDIYRLPAQNKGISIHTDSLAECMAYADRSMIHTVMRNLLNNAVKFSHPDGEIAVRITCEELRTHVSIKDKGVGMALTDNICPVSATTTGTGGEKGSGLGLIICKELLEQNGSRMIINSEVGVGTEIEFVLPNKYPDD